MYVSDLIKTKGREVATVSPDASLTEATAELKAKGIGALVVSSDGSEVAGILSERDIVRALADHGAEALGRKVSDFMSFPVKTCEASVSINEVMSEMTQSRIRHLPVVEDGKLAAIISIGDVVKNRLDELENETEVLRDYIGGRI